jgi:hypothetical protein
LPVFLGRRPAEHFDRDLHCFYTTLLEAINRPVFHDGEWTLCDRTGWPDNESFRNLLAWTWVHDDEHFLIAANLSDQPSEARIVVPWAEVGGGTWHLLDLLSGAVYERRGDELLSHGLYVGLGPWNYHFFHCLRIGKQEVATVRD